MIAFDAAKLALAHSSSLIDAGSQSASNQSSPTPWYYKVFFAGGIIAAAATVALAALQAYAAAIAAFACTISLGISAHFIKKLTLFKNLAGYTNDLTDRVKQLVVLIGQLKEGTKKLEEINLDLQKIPREWQQQILQEQKLLEQDEKNLQQVDQEEKTGRQQLDRFSLLLEELKKQNNQISESIFQFGEEHQNFDNEVNKLKKSLGLWNQHAEIFKKQTSALTQETDRLEQMMSIYQKQNTVFESLFDVMKKMYMMFPKQMKEIHEEVKKLKSSIPAEKKATDNLEQVANHLEKILKERQDYKQFLKWKKEQKI